MRAEFANDAFVIFETAYQCVIDDLTRAYRDFDIRLLTWELLPPEQNEHVAILMSYREEAVMLFEQWIDRVEYQRMYHARPN